MKNTSDLLRRLQRLMPAGVQPRFTTAEELLAWQQEEGRKRSVEVEKLNNKVRAEKIFGRSGIQNLHRNCTFKNYEVKGDGQRHALSLAKSYAMNFGNGFTSFVFSGSPGTGKNHLAAAIGNYLLAQNRSVLIVTVADLMLRVRACYDGGQSESALLDELDRVDLLVLDEVGIQKGSQHEKVLLNQIVDRRLAAMKPVGVLTNLNYDELAATLGERVVDRLKMDKGIWVNFTWGSFRSQVRNSQPYRQ
ncbi:MULTISPECIES: ATP-binding protein [Pantoea]|uniref:DNA replication protein DnaC n=1 Tax=Candidatus Pantoea gossypiicola TaxID=2608008 RepID=A0AB34CHX7_9GAMM|nr:MULTISPECIES: ATP-binding protein [Pantoea]KAA5927836.1 DNA replication protein DnaC [Pantoea sp. VH_8]KAA5932567.1 DNA replication protein DnaC [Pantoea sp. VH_4]KAA5984849.1 DNA replication protein DnaC [Pantoea sp. M_4]KAA6122210.1 DNA replication protein DnaC [Pantoea gossypiicola]